MEVEAAVETPLVFTGDRVQFSVTFLPPANNGIANNVPTLLSGYAVVQGSFKLGDMILSEPFANTRKQGIVLTRRGIEYGQPNSGGSLFAGVLDGLKHLVVANERRPGEGRPGSGALGSGGFGSGSSASSGTGSGRNTSGWNAGGDHDDAEYPIFATSQLLLFTDLKLTKPEKFYFSVDLPENLPPTYRSRSLQISYSLVVGFERIRLDVNSRPLDSRPLDTRLFLPFRVLSRPITSQNQPVPKFDLRNPINAPPPRLTTHAFVDQDEGASSHDSMLEFIDSLLDEANNKGDTRRGSISHPPAPLHPTKVLYDISKNKISIAQLVLAKPATSVGDVLAAQLRINRPCLHISVYLELEEQIEEPYAALAHMPLGSQNSNNGGNSGNGDGDSSSANTEPEVATAYTIYARQFQGVYGLKELPLYLPTLTSITPRLDTEQISATWSLRIEFVGLIGAAFAVDEENGLLAKGQVDHEIFTCRIPVTILPPSLGGHCTSKTWKY